MASALWQQRREADEIYFEVINSDFGFAKIVHGY